MATWNGSFEDQRHRPSRCPEGSTILEAARCCRHQIPTLCWLKEINAIGACRMCVVEVTGARGW